MGFTVDDLGRYLEKSRISEASVNFVKLAHEKGPSRRVGQSGYRCVATEFQSRKMGCTIQTESRTSELMFALDLEFDNDVIAFYDQPPEIAINEIRKTGSVVQRPYIADYIVLRHDSVTVVEVKRASELKALAEKNPRNWITSASEIHFRPAVEAFAKIGLRHVVVGISAENQIRGANLKLLLQSLKAPPPAETLVDAINKALMSTPILTLAKLASSVRCSNLAPIIALIARRELFADISSDLLTAPDTCRISLTAEIFTAALQWDADISVRQEMTLSEPDRRSSIATIPPTTQLKRGVEILSILKTAATGRSVRRWRKKIQDAQMQSISALVAVAPKTYRSGNELPKLAKAVAAHLTTFIDEKWAIPLKPTMSAAFRDYCTSAKEVHPTFKPVTKPTFKKYIELKDGEDAGNARGGKRAGNAAANPSPPEARALPPRRPFELGTCDHYLADIFCVMMDSNGVRYVQQPWVTVLRDCATKLVLAIWVSFQAPSRRACAMVMRRCLRAHGRLPETIIVDHGAEFVSVYFSAFCAHCAVDLAFRPSGDPRYGSEAERFFGQFKNLWLASRPGNKVSTKEIRAVSSKFKPADLAQLDLCQFLDETLDFVEWLNDRCTESADRAPSDLFKAGLEQYGCSGNSMPYDDDFVIASAVDVSEFSLDPSRGLHVGVHHYWHPKLATPGLRRSGIEARREPEDELIVYALVNGDWITCRWRPRIASVGTDFVQRIATAIRTLDMADARQQAKDDADRNLVHKIRAADKRRADEDAPKPYVSPPPTQRPDDVFDKVGLRSGEALAVSEW